MFRNIVKRSFSKFNYKDAFLLETQLSPDEK